MCKNMDEMSERIRKERGLPKGTMIPLAYVCTCDKCQKNRPRY
jgi:hypothetical protein